MFATLALMPLTLLAVSFCLCVVPVPCPLSRDVAWRQRDRPWSRPCPQPGHSHLKLKRGNSKIGSPDCNGRTVQRNPCGQTGK
ncbi:hypothetical protein DFW101_3418 [Solidesulfovibrio carbinoliphilus subsp. oakridgensis]|uniref:Uncharacterized protein n=1 Tax=Solidesulfovibrio carbinoliphilus subsp. oakridgensis TaxID=694327 RepID=G7QBS3_9BACT|nr:hypothetical protein DFW101_3418 [Solidesulfovibrio carbinoliphilus subsp. oakridgensis]